MTCNPDWPDILNGLLAGQRSDDKTDLRDRVFSVKLNLLLKYMKEDEPCVKLSAPVFQKAGVSESSYHYFSRLFNQVFATRPHRHRQPNFIWGSTCYFSHLRESVLDYMIHAVCSDNPDSRFMKEEKSSKNFPNRFVQRQFLSKAITMWVAGEVALRKELNSKLRLRKGMYQEVSSWLLTIDG